MSSRETYAVECLNKNLNENRLEDIQQLDSTPTVPNLSEDDIVSILQWLSAKELVRLECVSRQWKDVLIPRSFGRGKIKSLNLNDFIKSPREWRNSTSGVSGFNIFSKLLDLMGSSLICINLTTRRVYVEYYFNAVELQLLTTKCPRLRHMEIGGNAILSSCVAQLPLTVDSITLANLVHLKPTDLEEFLRTHPGLTQFRLTTTDNYIHLPQLLSQYCTEVTHLYLAMEKFRTVTVRNLPVVKWHFGNVFSSLTSLKELELLVPGLDVLHLKDICANCLDLQVLTVRIEYQFVMNDSTFFGGLEKLKRLDLASLRITDQFVMGLCEAVGSTLEFLQLQSNTITGDSLRAIGSHCHNLANLRFIKADYLTVEGMTKLIKDITSNQSWKDPTYNRHLHIVIESRRRFDVINLEDYEDRVQLVDT